MSLEDGALSPSDPVADVISYQEIARRQAHPPLVRRAGISSLELLATLAPFLPFPLWVLGGGVRWLELPLLVALLVAAGSGMLIRRLPSPLPSVGALPAATVWVVAVLVLPGGVLALVCAMLAGIALVLYAALPAPGELAPPAVAVLSQAMVPILGGGLSLLVAISLLGVAAPLYAVVLVPTLGALALAVHLFSKEEGVGGGQERPA